MCRRRPASPSRSTSSALDEAVDVLVGAVDQRRIRSALLEHRGQRRFDLRAPRPPTRTPRVGERARPRDAARSRRLRRAGDRSGTRSPIRAPPHRRALEASRPQSGHQCLRRRDVGQLAHRRRDAGIGHALAIDDRAVAFEQLQADDAADLLAGSRRRRPSSASRSGVNHAPWTIRSGELPADRCANCSRLAGDGHACRSRVRVVEDDGRRRLEAPRCGRRRGPRR